MCYSVRTLVLIDGSDQASLSNYLELGKPFCDQPSPVLACLRASAQQCNWQVYGRKLPSFNYHLLTTVQTNFDVRKKSNPIYSVTLNMALILLQATNCIYCLPCFFPRFFMNAIQGDFLVYKVWLLYNGTNAVMKKTHYTSHILVISLVV